MLPDASTNPTYEVHAVTVDNQNARRAVASWRGPRTLTLRAVEMHICESSVAKAVATARSNEAAD